MPHGKGNTRLQCQRKRARNKAYVDNYKATHPCVKCGESDPTKLTFHHRNPAEKFFNIAELKHSHKTGLLKKEIAKCDVWCVKCHREHNIRVDKERANERPDKGRVIQVGQSVEVNGRTDSDMVSGRTI
jgi:hypothetical protein